MQVAERFHLSASGSEKGRHEVSGPLDTGPTPKRLLAVTFFHANVGLSCFSSS